MGLEKEVVYFGNELGTPSFNLYDRMLSSDRVHGVYLPTLDVEMAFQAGGGTKFLGLKMGDRVLIASSARPLKMSLEEYKSFARRLSALNSEGKPMYLSMYFSKPSTIVLLLEKLSLELEEAVAGVEINLVPLYATPGEVEREKLVLKIAEAAREARSGLRVVARIPYCIAYCEGLARELLKSFEAVTISLHPLLEVGGVSYFLHSPLSSKIALEGLRLAAGEVLDEFRDSIEVSTDVLDYREAIDLSRRFSAVHLDLNLVLGDGAIAAVSEPSFDIRRPPEIPRPQEELEIRVSRDLCDKCDEYYPCRYLCPENAIEVGWDGYPKILVDRCTACGLCLAACPKGALELVRIIRPS